MLYMPMTMAASTDQQLFGACNANTQSSPVCQSQGTQTDPVIHIINVAANIIALLTGIAAVILIIVSGLTMVASGGNQEAVANSRKRITAAIIGLVIVALAWTITRFITDRLVQ